jgi:ribonuclease BN (tRNA processing enzyme)
MNNKLYQNNDTKVVLLGTGTPNADPYRSGPSVAVVVGSKSYIVDFGPGVVRQAAKAYRNGIDSLAVNNLTHAFLTHLHSDHTIGYPDLILTPWVLERTEPLKVYGPKGLKSMTEHILQAYGQDLNERLNGLEPANRTGWRVEVNEIISGKVYEDEYVKVEAFPVKHGAFDAYGYKFYTPDKTIVISGDTAPTDSVLDAAMGCDILVHEVYSTAGVEKRTPDWKKYHTSVHTSARELGKIAAKVQPGLLVLYHQLFMIDIQSNDKNLLSQIAEKDQEILSEIKENYNGKVISGKDLDIF